MPDTRDPDSTRDRIVEAAKREFSGYGIAGSRIDRIAKEARTSKERIYAYFGSKEELYAHVAEREFAKIAAAIPLDPTDLPGYAGQVYDYFAAHPDHFRLMQWGRLEVTPSADPDVPMQVTVRHKLTQLREAQDAGLLDPTWDPVDILILVSQIALAGVGQPEMDVIASQNARGPLTSARRGAIVEAVQRLFPARTQAQTDESRRP
jgi:AcrR family transcriptional regulator